MAESWETPHDSSWLAPYLRHLILLLQYADRVAEIAIQTTASRLFEEFLPKMQEESFPLLDCIDLLHDSWLLLPNTCLQIQYPKLETLRISRITISLSPVVFEALQILCLAVCEIPFQHLCALADTSPRLKSLNLEAVYLSGPLARCARFACLESLILQCNRHTEVMLSCLDAPILSSLTLAHTTLAPTMSQEIHHPRIFPTVRTLCFLNVSIRPPQQYGDYLLQCTPQVSTFELRACSGADYQLLRHITTVKPTPLLYLQTLAVTHLAEDIFIMPLL
ncbi:uncharacterized protein PHACADRAFT_253637, partial [Phanerochaete carnosa HHB-10118-sp]